jgi:hypothetical protein
VKDGLTAEIRVRTPTSISEIHSEAESGLVGLEVYKYFGALFKGKRVYKITNTKLGTKMNISVE